MFLDFFIKLKGERKKEEENLFQNLFILMRSFQKFYKIGSNLSNVGRKLREGLRIPAVINVNKNIFLISFVYLMIIFFSFDRKGLFLFKR